MPEEVASYMQRNAIKATFADLLDGCCRDLPAVDTLPAYLLAKLCEKFPAAAKTIEIEKSLLEWKASKIEINAKVQLTTYLADLRFTSYTQALLERVIYERPKNVPAFLIELLVKGDVAPAGPEELSDDLAATKMQAVHRGRKGRKAARDKKSAVEVPQAANADEQVDSYEAQTQEAANEAAAAAVMSEDRAATKMQAMQRGKQARKK